MDGLWKYFARNGVKWDFLKRFLNTAKKRDIFLLAVTLSFSQGEKEGSSRRKLHSFPVSYIENRPPVSRFISNDNRMTIACIAGMSDVAEQEVWKDVFFQKHAYFQSVYYRKVK